MKEKIKLPGDHRTISNPIPERKDFIKHIKNNLEKVKNRFKKSKSNEHK